MTITKKHIDTWFGSYVLMTATTQEKLRVSFIYTNNGMYEITVRLAKRPQNKWFKGWEQIGWTFECEDEYSSIDEMLKTIATIYLNRHKAKKCLELQRSKKWKEFVENS